MTKVKDMTKCGSCVLAMGACKTCINYVKNEERVTFIEKQKKTKLQLAKEIFIMFAETAFVFASLFLLTFIMFAM